MFDHTTGNKRVGQPISKHHRPAGAGHLLEQLVTHLAKALNLDVRSI